MVFFKLGKLDSKKKKKEDPGELTEAREEREKGTEQKSSSSSQAGPSVNEFISKTKSRQQQGLKPTGPELIAYARYLGIDPVADHDLLWIAEEALAAPLPAEWTEHFDSSDRVFYYNAATHVSSWTHPLEHVYRTTYKTIVDFRNSNLTPQERSSQLHELQHECQQQEQEVHREITAWSEHTDERGHKFYFNREVGHSSWTDPRPAKCHILYLKMKMIRVLCQHAGVNLVDGRASGGLLSRFEMINSTLDGGDASSKASKRPTKEGREGREQREGRLRENQEGSLGDLGPSDRGAFGEDIIDLGASGGGITDLTQGEGPSGGSNFLGGNSIIDDADYPKKEKKHKKHRKHEKGMHHSQSEPSVGMVGQSLGSGWAGGAGSGAKVPEPPSAVEELRHGMGYATGPSMVGPRSPGDGQGLTQQGRVKVKAGIRLEPLKHQLGESPMPGEPGLRPHGMTSSASVPTLAPLHPL